MHTPTHADGGAPESGDYGGWEHASFLRRKSTAWGKSPPADLVCVRQQVTRTDEPSCMLDLEHTDPTRPPSKQRGCTRNVACADQFAGKFAGATSYQTTCSSLARTTVRAFTVLNDAACALCRQHPHQTLAGVGALDSLYEAAVA